MKIASQESGQVTIEAVLLITIFVAVFTVVNRQVKNQDWFGQMVNGPWPVVQGMIENGVWAEPQAGLPNHPNQFTTRRASPAPDP